MDGIASVIGFHLVLISLQPEGWGVMDPVGLHTV